MGRKSRVSLRSATSCDSLKVLRGSKVRQYRRLGESFDIVHQSIKRIACTFDVTPSNGSGNFGMHACHFRKVCSLFVVNIPEATRQAMH